MVSSDIPAQSGTMTSGGLPPAQRTGGESGGRVRAEDQEQTTPLADTAQEQARHVAGEAGDQVRSVMQQAKTELDDQSRTQRDRLVETLRGFGADLGEMSGQAKPGLAADLTRQVAERAQDLGARLDGREPRELLDELRSYARRNPGKFLLGALAAGMVAGRLARGAKDAAASPDSSGGGAATSTGPSTPGASVAAGPAGGAHLEGTLEPPLPGRADVGGPHGDESS